MKGLVPNGRSLPRVSCSSLHLYLKFPPNLLLLGFVWASGAQVLAQWLFFETAAGFELCNGTSCRSPVEQLSPEGHRDNRLALMAHPASNLSVVHGDGRRFSKVCWDCYDDCVHENKEVKDAIPVWRRRGGERCVVPGWDKCMVVHVNRPTYT